MRKKAFIIHGWGGYPGEGWFPWLKRELEKINYEVSVPSMPNPEEPKISEWTSFLSDHIVSPDKNTFLVGHSMGCQAILRYLENLPSEIKIGGVFLVAGFVNLVNLESKEEREIAKPWLTKPINWNKVKLHIDKIVSIFSDNDTWVPLSDSKIFKDRLGAEIIVEKEKGHFSGDDNVKMLPILLKHFTS